MKLDKYDKIILDNGMAIYLVPSKHMSQVCVGYSVFCGGRNEEDDKLGIAHFVEHLLFTCGTKKRPGPLFMNSLKELGVEFNASTGYEVTSYYFKTEPAHVKNVVEIALDMITNPFIRAKDIRNEKQIIIQEMIYRSGYSVHSFITKRFGEKTTLDRSLIGTTETLDNITQKDIVNFLKTYYQPNNMSFVVCGNFHKNVILKMIKPVLSSLENTDLPRRTYNDEESIILRKINEQTKPFIEFRLSSYPSNVECYFLFPIIDYSPKYHAVEVLTYAVKDGLQDELRTKRGITYSPHCYVMNDGIPVFVIKSFVSIMYLTEVMKIYILIMKKLKKTELSTKSFKSLILTAKNTYLASFPDMVSYYDYFSTHHFYSSNDKFDKGKELKQYENLKKTSIKKAAQDIFVPARLNVYIYGNFYFQKTNFDFIDNF